MAIFGAMTALVTPFKNGKLDEVAYERLIRRQIAGGIDAVSPVGTTGESATLTHEEHRRCIEIAVSVCKEANTAAQTAAGAGCGGGNGGAGAATGANSNLAGTGADFGAGNGASATATTPTTPKHTAVLAGAGSNATHEAIELAKFAQRCGADALLSVAPYYNKPTQEGLFAHYKAIADSVEIPVMLYNVPGRTGSDIQPETAARLFAACENIYAIKDATGDIERCMKTLILQPRMAVFSGDDAMNYPMLACGAKGVVSVTSNLLPGQVARLVAAVFAGRFDEARAVSDELFEINKILFCESNPIPLKAAMYAVGLLDTLEYRLPLCAPSAENYKKIEAAVRKFF